MFCLQIQKAHKHRKKRGKNIIKRQDKIFFLKIFIFGILKENVNMKKGVASNYPCLKTKNK